MSTLTVEQTVKLCKIVEKLRLEVPPVLNGKGVTFKVSPDCLVVHVMGKLYPSMRKGTREERIYSTAELLWLVDPVESVASWIASKRQSFIIKNR